MPTDVIVPVYTKTAYTEELASMSLWQLKHSQPDLNIILVDNGWPHDRFGTLCHDYIRLEENQGYAGGVNAGLERSTSDIIVVSSIDVFVPQNWLWHLSYRVVAEGGGIASPAAKRFMYGTDLDELEAPECAFWGGIFAMTRDVYDTIGGLDTENFRLRWSDTDYAIRAVKAGFYVGRVHELVVEHRDPSISTLFMDKVEVDQELQRLYEVHGEFEFGRWKAEQFS